MMMMMYLIEHSCYFELSKVEINIYKSTNRKLFMIYFGKENFNRRRFARGVGTASFAAIEIFETLERLSGSKDTVDDPTPALLWL